MKALKKEKWRWGRRWVRTDGIDYLTAAAPFPVIGVSRPDSVIAGTISEFTSRTCPRYAKSNTGCWYRVNERCLTTVCKKKTKEYYRCINLWKVLYKETFCSWRIREVLRNWGYAWVKFGRFLVVSSKITRIFIIFSKMVR